MIRTVALAALAVMAFSGIAEAKGQPRNRAEKCAFLRSQGVHDCRVPKGMVVDHVNPICNGGADTRGNMQLQSVAASKVKDRWERSICRKR